MKAQQLLDYIIKPTLKFMGGNYDSKNARMLLLSTAAIESNCGYYIKQIGGPALGIWQMEPATHNDIWSECDALYDDLGQKLPKLISGLGFDAESMLNSPMYACAMARLKYSMDPSALPSCNDVGAVYDYYKRIFNTPLGASTFGKFVTAWDVNGLSEITL